ncbi:MAG TPA: hypothetical protein VMJ10_31845 [Kofleriaceae bacterium]|nr:hypothetical protein [Kofleriaceae bacterium]
MVSLPALRAASVPIERATEPLRLVHHHAGYLRVQADAFVGSSDGRPVSAARAATEAVPGVRTWTHNPSTGSVVITYDPATIEADELVKHVANSAGLSGVENALRHRVNRLQVADAIMDAVQGVNGVVRQLAADRADLRELLPLALAVTSVASFILNEDRGRLPQWSNALYHSYRIFMHWHRPEMRGRERVSRQQEAERIRAEEGGDVR